MTSGALNHRRQSYGGRSSDVVFLSSSSAGRHSDTAEPLCREKTSSIFVLNTKHPFSCPYLPPIRAGSGNSELSKVLRTMPAQTNPIKPIGGAASMAASTSEDRGPHTNERTPALLRLFRGPRARGTPFPPTPMRKRAVPGPRFPGPSSTATTTGAGAGADAGTAPGAQQSAASLSAATTPLPEHDAFLACGSPGPGRPPSAGGPV